MSQRNALLTNMVTYTNIGYNYFIKNFYLLNEIPTSELETVRLVDTAAFP